MHMINDTFSLEPEDLNYLLFSSEDTFRWLEEFASAIMPRRGVLIRILSFFRRGLLGLKDRHQSRIRPGHVGKRLYFISTRNQIEALAPLFTKDSQSLLVGIGEDVQLRFPNEFRAHLLSLLFLPIVVLRFIGARGYRREAYAYSFDRIWLAYGYYMAARLGLRQLVPKCVILANDHTFEHRTIRLAAIAEKIPTIYLQHASVTAHFPPLEFDFAFLQGRQSMKIYEAIGPSSTRVYLLGSPKYDTYHRQINEKLEAERFGICLNLLDHIDQVEELCVHILTRFPELSIVIRPHPADERKDLWCEIAEKFQIERSDSSEVTSYEFLADVDAIIAGNSNILLEAVLMNVYPMFYPFEHQKRMRPYNFIEEGLVDCFSTTDAICDEIERLMNSKPTVRMRAASYESVLGSQNEGKSSDLAIDLLERITTAPFIQPEIWKPITDSNLTAFTPYSG